MTQGVDAVKARNARKAPVPAPTFEVVVDPYGNGDVRTIAEAAALLPTTGGRIQLRRGTHQITQTVVLPQNTTVVGEGRSNTIITLGGLSIAAFQLTGNTTPIDDGYTRFADFRLESGGTYPWPTGTIFVDVASSGLDVLVFERIHIETIEKTVRSSTGAYNFDLDTRDCIFTYPQAPAGANCYFIDGNVLAQVHLYMYRSFVGGASGFKGVSIFYAEDCQLFCQNGITGTTGVGCLGYFLNCTFDGGLSAPTLTFASLKATGVEWRNIAAVAYVGQIIGGIVSGGSLPNFRMGADSLFDGVSPGVIGYTIRVDGGGAKIANCYIDGFSGPNYCIDIQTGVDNTGIVNCTFARYFLAAVRNQGVKCSITGCIGLGTAQPLFVNSGANAATFVDSNVLASVAADQVLTSLPGTQRTFWVDATAANRTITLPPVASSINEVIIVKKIDTSNNKVIVAANGAETIDGQLTYTLGTQWDSVTLICTGAAWRVLANIGGTEINHNVQTVNTTPITLDANYEIVLVDATGGARVLNLPAVATNKGRMFQFKKIDATGNNVSITPNGAELVEGVNAPLILSVPNETVSLICDGTAWYVIG